MPSLDGGREIREFPPEAGTSSFLPLYLSILLPLPPILLTYLSQSAVLHFAMRMPGLYGGREFREFPPEAGISLGSPALCCVLLLFLFSYLWFMSLCRPLWSSLALLAPRG